MILFAQTERFFVPLTAPKVLSLDNKRKKRFFFVLCSFIRTFAAMKKIIRLIILFLTIGTSLHINAQTTDREIRAVWLTTIGGIDWPRQYANASSSSSIERQKQELTRMLDRLKAININTILLQTRIRGSVIYPSKYEPWDGCMSGKPGVSPGYDPLRFAIDECHKRGMEIHAWVVTIPMGKWNGIGCQQMRKKNASVLRKIGDEGYLNPELPQTADIIADICEEITKNYNVDGIHLDYIRYPENWKLRVSKQQGRENITRIVRKIHSKVKAIKPQIKLSCSPLGKFDDLTRYPSRGWNARTTVCQDAQMWLRTGLMDQLYPMLYFKDNNFYPFAIDWAERSKAGQVAAGLAIYMLDPKEGNWKISEVKRQLNVCRQLGLGQCFFRAKFVLDNHQGIYDYLRVFNFAQQGMDGFAYPYYSSNNTIQSSGNTVSLINTQVPDPKQIRQDLPWIVSNGQRVSLPNKSEALDTDMILVKNLAGNAVATLVRHGNQMDIHTLPNGMFILYTLDKRGKTHRLAFLKKQ